MVNRECREELVPEPYASFANCRQLGWVSNDVAPRVPRPALALPCGIRVPGDRRSCRIVAGRRGTNEDDAGGVQVAVTSPGDFGRKPKVAVCAQGSGHTRSHYVEYLKHPEKPRCTRRHAGQNVPRYASREKELPAESAGAAPPAKRWGALGPWLGSKAADLSAVAD
jgi:hypothetical protein